jgi:tetratricopeptide (TPR) repeat protein
LVAAGEVQDGLVATDPVVGFDEFSQTSWIDRPDPDYEIPDYGGNGLVQVGRWRAAMRMRLRDESIGAVAIANAQFGDVDDALTIARNLNPPVACATLAAVATELHTRGDKARSVTALEEAVDICRDLDEGQRVDGLIAVGSAQAACGRPTQGLDSYRRALGLGQRLGEDASSETTEKVVYALSGSGLHSEAQALAGTIQDEEVRRDTMSDLAVALAEDGDYPEAIRLAATIIDPDLSDSGQGLAWIADHAADERRDDVLADIIARLNSEYDAYSHVQRLRAKVAARDGRYDDIESYLGAIITDEELVDALVDLSADPDVPSRLTTKYVQRAIEGAERSGTGRLADMLRAGIVEAFATTDLALATKTAEDIQSVGWRSIAFTHIAVANARVGSVDAAVATSRKIVSARAGALSKITASFSSETLRDGLKAMMPEASAHGESAFQVCSLLAKVYPGAFDGILEVVSQS